MATDNPVHITLDSALHTHQLWKNKLQDAVKAGAALDVDTIRRDDCCQLGQWLYSDGRAVYGHTPEFSKLLATHESFHVVASIVANIINGKDYAQARSMLEGSSQFSAASTDVALAILQLKAAVKVIA
jgi:hypothetical protein